MRQRDVVILGGGLAGLAAAQKLNHLDLEVLEAAEWVGGRTRSVRLPGGPWMNFGAQYITEDRPVIVELADSLGVELIHSEMFEDYYKLLLPDDPAARAEVEAGMSRIEEAQSQPRPVASPELDDVSFADWLGPMSEAAADYFDRITLLMNCASTVDLSVVGGLWVWGEQRTSPWNTADIPHHDRGELVVAGGTSELADIVLPSAAWVEREGTFTNFEGRVQRFRTAVDPFGSARPDWDVLGHVLATVTGEAAPVRAEQWFRRLAEAVPAFAGMTYRSIGDTGQVVSAA